MTQSPPRDESVCMSCRLPIKGTKVATPDAGVLCTACARASHAIPMPRRFDANGQPVDW
ncbi:MAG: hypothetical protein ACRENE_28270 [Polyangiaceae bacterium]